MRVSSLGVIKVAAAAFFWSAIFTCPVLAQTITGTLRGQVTDPSGAVIPQARISATAANGQKSTAASSNDGVYQITSLEPGKYTVTAIAKGFTPYQQQNVTVSAGETQQLNIALEIQVEHEKVEVQEQGTSVDVAPSNNASAIIIQGKDLEALSDDPDELQAELQALAGPAAGPNGGQIYIDGFTAGQLPPKASIREIRINQNPFSAQYDRLGYGRIEIFTKPGTSQYHGQVFFNANNSALNSLNPFVTASPSYGSQQYSGSVGGPLSKKASFFVNAERRDINDTSIVDAVVLASNFNQVPFSQAIPNTRTRTTISPRVDYQLAANNTLTARYQFTRNNDENAGIGQFSLPLQTYNFSDAEHTLQISDTQTLSPRTVNETRFQYIHDANNTVPTILQTGSLNNLLVGQNLPQALVVLGAFIGGPNSIGTVADSANRYELQNYSSLARGKHFIIFGGRLRGVNTTNSATTNFNGTFTFPSFQAYRNTEMGLQQGLSLAQIRVAGGGASQFSIIAGTPQVKVTMFDGGLYAEDSWRIKPNFTLIYGLRFETQNDIHDHADFAPRVGIAWGVGRHSNTSPKTVLRAGFGIFYDRFGYNLVAQAERLNGITQQQIIVSNPAFFPTVPAGELPGGQISPTIYQISSKLRAPYTMQSAVSIERQVTKSATVALTYLNSRGEHQLFIRNINAPLSGTGVRPLGGSNNIYEYDSEGIFRQNQLIANFRVSAGAKLSLFGAYTLNYANSDLGTGGSPGFLSHPYDPMADYGPASFNVRHRVFLGGMISLPQGFRLSPFIIASSGQPFNVTVGNDLNGDSIFNDRPAFATSTSKNVITTPLGIFDPNPVPGETVIPVNYGTGPTLFTMNLRVSKTFGFGKKQERGAGGGLGGPGGRGDRGGGGHGGLGGRGLTGGGGGLFGMGAPTNRRYNLTFSASARNLLNRVNLGVPVGNLNSPLFDQSNSLAGPPFSSGSANRRIDLQVLFNF